MKILIIAGGLQLGGAERVAADLSRHAPEGYEFHYLVFEGLGNAYGAEIEARGGRVLVWPSPSNGFAAYLRRLKKLMRTEKYDAVHSHTMFNSGLNLWAAKRCGVAVRIAHSHTTRTETPVPAVQKIYEAVMRRLILHTATHCFACGEAAGEWLFGEKAFRARGTVIRNGIDTERFRYREESRAFIRRQYCIPDDAFVIGHAGTLLPLKNQAFLIRLLPDILRRQPHARLMLAGEGTEDMTASLRALAQELGVSERVTFCGGVRNVHEHLSAMDVFCFPSLREGTPLALLEAQANGLPCIVSARVPTDAFVTDLVTPLPLEERERWTEAVLHAARRQASSYAAAAARAGCDVNTAYAPVYRAYKGAGRVCLSFDDGRGDNAMIAAEVLRPLAIPATFNISTGYVDGSCPEALRPSSRAAMTQEDVVRLAADPLWEIALHGDRHRNTAEDILAGQEKLRRWLALPAEHAFGFASPGSGFPVSGFDPAGEPWRSHRIVYLRTGPRIRQLRPWRLLCRRAARMIPSPLLYRIAYADTLMENLRGNVFYSVPVMRDNTLAQVQALVRSCEKTGRTLVLMFHSILPCTAAEDQWSWPRDRFEALCRDLQQRRERGTIELCTEMDLIK